MRLLVCGSRSIIITPEDLTEIINEKGIKNITEIISGGAQGPDTTAIRWAEINHIPYTIRRPDWNKYGNGAGIIRNKEMVEMCDECLSIWNGRSKGSESTMHFAEEMEKPLYVKVYT